MFTVHTYRNITYIYREDTLVGDVVKDVAGGWHFNAERKLPVKSGWRPTHDWAVRVLIKRLKRVL